MRIALAQLNPTVGDLTGNRLLVEEAVDRAAAARADVLVVPELVLSGYPPMDLLEREGFVADQVRELKTLEAASQRVPIVLGAVLPGAGARELMNACVLLAGGKRVAVRAKSLLPTYDIFDEKRYFTPASKRETVALGTRTVGLTVCEDTWVEPLGYALDPVGDLVAAGARLVFNPSCSPWHVGKSEQRRRMIAELAARHSVPVIFVNQVGGNDELLFDGGSFASCASGRVHGALPLFETAFGVLELPGEAGLSPDAVEDPEEVVQLERGLVLGIRDYFRKLGLPPQAVVGLSGGIDSAVTAHLAVEALGAEGVLGVAMPGPFSSAHSVEDARALGDNLGIEVRNVDIGRLYAVYREIFASLFGERDDYGIAQQNIQSRIRGSILMSISNAENRLVLATGNKSELSVGYCTLYGDTVGGLSVLGDVYKHDVYALARFANSARQRIPPRTLEKPPSAELAPDQLDSDDLPDYPLLDAILRQAIEGLRGASSIEPPPGASAETVREVLGRLDRNEYKRRQSPLVLRTSPKAFGSGRRLPIVHRY
ncbi:MAG: NAD+ synthase [Myxococcales bacterium]|nr:NAD+ synthase [Myxococcales bacterium]